MLRYLFIICFFLALSGVSQAQMPSLRTGNEPLPPAAQPAAKQAPAQPSARPAARPAADDTVKMWLAYGNIQRSFTPSGQQRCKISIKLRNGTYNLLKRMQIRFIWPGWENDVNFVLFKPGQSNSITYTIPGDTCNVLDATPRIIVNTCIMDNVSAQECVGAITIKKWNEF